MPVCLAGMRGLTPRLDDFIGGGIFAEIAKNVDFSRGRLDPWRKPRKCTKVTGKTAHVHKCKWRSFDSSSVSVLHSITGRSYLSNPCDPCVWFYTDWCNDGLCPLGVPRPEAATITGTGSNPTDEDCWQPELVTVTLTYLNDKGEESRPSRPSNQIKCKKGDALTITIPACPDVKFNVTTVCVYISHTTWDASQGMHARPSIGVVGDGNVMENFETNADIDCFKIFEIPKNMSQTVVEYDNKDIPCGKTLTTNQWYQPPEGMCLAGESETGSLVGWTDKALYYSVRNSHHAWPIANKMTFGADIEYACHWGLTTWVLTCTGNLFIVTDDVDCTVSEDGACRSVQRVGKVPRICLDKTQSHKAVICGRYGLIYPSREGLIRVSFDGATANLTSAWISCRQWEAECCGDISMAEYKGMLFFRWGKKSYVLDINLDGLTNGEVHQSNLSEICLTPDCWISDCDGDLFLLDCNGNIYQFDAGSSFMDMHYKSGAIYTNGLTFNSIFVEYSDVSRCDTIPSDCSKLVVHADGKAVSQAVINSSRPTRVKRVSRAHSICFEYKGTASVRRFCLGGSFSDLGTVAA